MNKSVPHGDSTNNILTMRHCLQCIRCPQRNVTCRNFEFWEWLMLVNDLIGTFFKSAHIVCQSRSMTYLNLNLWNSTTLGWHFRFVLKKFLTLTWPKLCNFHFDSQVLIIEKWDTKFSTGIDALLMNISYFESWKFFSIKRFLGHPVLFIFQWCSLW